jgi:hypothetical protein
MIIEKKILTENDLYEIIDKLIEYYDIKNYIKNIKISNDVKLYGYYNSLSKELYINRNLIISDSFKKNRLDIMNMSRSSYLKVNFDILFNLFHEIEHINQIKYINEGTNSAIKEALILGYDEQLLSKLSNSDKYYKFHDMYIHEYNANVLAAMKINDFIMNDESKKYSKDVLFKQFCYGYYIRPDGITCPLKEYLKTIDKDKNINLENNISEYDKVAYGLLIDELTYNKIKLLDKNEITTYKEYFNR